MLNLSCRRDMAYRVFKNKAIVFTVYLQIVWIVLVCADCMADRFAAFPAKVRLNDCLSPLPAAVISPCIPLKCPYIVGVLII